MVDGAETQHHVQGGRLKVQPVQFVEIADPHLQVLEFGRKGLLPGPLHGFRGDVDAQDLPVRQRGGDGLLLGRQATTEGEDA